MNAHDNSNVDRAPLKIYGPTHKNVALVVVTYFPDETFIARIHSAGAQFRVVVIVDNSETERKDLQSLNAAQFQIINNASNVGLGHALNVGCAHAITQGFDWAVTLDQDTELYPYFLSGMLNAWCQSGRLTALLGSNYFNVSRSRFRVAPTDRAQPMEQVTVITSGCLTHLPTWSAVGMFRGDYFIDSIDHEFCLRVRSVGYAVAINSKVGMSHNIGERLEYRTAFARFIPYRHSIWRKYTSARNSTRTVLDYATSEPLWSVRKVVGIFMEFLAIVLLEPDKWLRVRAFSLGLLHGCRGRLGPVPEDISGVD